MRILGKDHYADFASLKEYLEGKRQAGWTAQQAWAYVKTAKVAIIMVRLDEHPNTIGIMQDVYKWRG